MTAVSHSSPVLLMDRAAIAAAVRMELERTPIVDMHTHLFPPSFGECSADPRGLMLWGIDELLTYHYLVAELLRAAQGLEPEAFYAMPKAAQAETVWRELFVERSPVSEACRGVLTSLQALGLDTASRDLEGYRSWFNAQNPDEHLTRVMDLAGVQTITMTNDPFDDNERSRWMSNSSVGDDPRFRTALRIDPLLVSWPTAAARLRAWGYGDGLDEVRRFLCEWIERIKPAYVAASLPPAWQYPEDSPGQRILSDVILPLCRDYRMPMALMIGVQRQVNPAMRLAGDMGRSADVLSLVRLAVDHPGNRFLVTMLSRENQHELAVAARKCGNLTPFGCWWFMNIPSMVDEITRMRLELLGTSFIPQHSDCRVLEQLIYKWDHSRSVIASALTERYADLVATGWSLTVQDVGRDVKDLLRENYLRLINPT